MNTNGKHAVVLLAEDDDDDYKLICDALREARIRSELRRVHDGEELMDYLYRRRSFANAASSPVPALILLDLNMPRKDGRECLRDIKSDARLQAIPIVVLTTSSEEEDVYQSYELGANSFIKKPAAFADLVAVVQVLARYWLEIAETPPFKKSATQR
jgi:DNA-binding response OmpR family regulator